MKLYAISGLGADKRVYSCLNLDCELIPIDWIKPKKHESLKDYSLRLSEIIDTDSEFGIIGVSFGGLVAVEISKILNPKITILISSAATRKEIPLIYRVTGKSGILSLIPKRLFNPPRGIARVLFGARNTTLLNKILEDTDLNFAKWAVNEVVNWDNSTQLTKLIRIHGANDKLLPWKGSGKVHLIDGGEHFMIVDRAEEISEFINKELKSLQNID
ncbi:alpha/beta hydrolase [Marinigracilibium pacificum]|uniref:Alpha/beta hydrolase n=1 Tax=Marinigracilibium pacificum TaxID=2729599 RepID=A0A848IWL1_9BACT|nr:alpha/beta hydrolase [Marinigracilibium pacificum]NMM47665.1 alpha/beta hydrolase [Marinigracilibium pacificum]